MVIEIGGKEYELHFGWDFIETINKINGIEVKGMSMNTGGVSMLDAQLDMNDPIALKKAIQAGTSTEKRKPSVKDIQDFIESLIEDENEDAYEEFVGNLKKQLSTQTLTKKAMEND